MVQPSISSQGSNSSIQVSWNKPPGNVDIYTVFLEPEGREMKTMNTSVTFDGLSAGRNYSARVVTHSGPRNSSSTFVSNATCKSQTFLLFLQRILDQQIPVFHGTLSAHSHVTPEYRCCPCCGDAFKMCHMMVPFMSHRRGAPALWHLLFSNTPSRQAEKLFMWNMLIMQCRQLTLFIKAQPSWQTKLNESGLVLLKARTWLIRLVGHICIFYICANTLVILHEWQPYRYPHFVSIIYLFF